MDATAENHGTRKSGEKRDRAFVVKNLPPSGKRFVSGGFDAVKKRPGKGQKKLRKDRSLPAKEPFVY